MDFHGGGKMSTALAQRTTLRTLVTVPEVGILLPLGVAFAVFATMNSAFTTGPTIASIIRTGAFLGIIAIGQSMLLVAGEFDLSVGSVAGLGSAVAGYLMATANLSVWLAVAAGILAGAGAGLVNGLFAVRIGLPAFIVTLGMLFIARGLTLVISNGQPIYPLPVSFNNLERLQLMGLPLHVFVFLGLAVGGELVLRRTSYGRRLYVTGGNRAAASLAGINTTILKISAYVLTGTLSALAGIFVMSSISRGEGSLGQGYELNVIAAVAVGGVSLFGGVGSVVGGLLGLLFLQVVATGLVIVGVDSSLQPVAVGIVMILAVAGDVWRRRLVGIRTA